VDKNRDYAQVLEERSSGSLIVSYIYGDDLISQKRGSTTHYYNYDGLGSTRALTTNDATISDAYTYDAFGNLLEKTGNTINNYLFTGEQYDPNIGFYYLRARYYLPQTGRFLTFDEYSGSINDPQSLHKYLYVYNNPVNNLDLSGNSVIGSVIGSVGISDIISSIFPPLMGFSWLTSKLLDKCFTDFEYYNHPNPLDYEKGGMEFRLTPSGFALGWTPGGAMYLAFLTIDEWEKETGRTWPDYYLCEWRITDFSGNIIRTLWIHRTVISVAFEIHGHCVGAHPLTIPIHIQFSHMP